MARRFVKQPNGKLAVFSDVVDDFTVYDMTKEEALEYCRNNLDLGSAASEEKVQAGYEDHIPWTHREIGPGDSRWKDALKTIALVHGADKLKSTLVDLGFGDYDINEILEKTKEEREDRGSDTPTAS